jgi:SNF2 family DNA or RNA helicase
VGQKRDVRVIRFVTRRTVEERILQLQNKKRSMIRGAMHHKLTADDVKMLFSTFED